MKETCKFPVGDFTCFAIMDGTFVFPQEVLFANAPADSLGKVLSPYGVRQGQVTGPYTSLLIDTGREKVLVDTGVGAGGTGGRLMENLRGLGMKAEDINYVLLTHAHLDHIGGNLKADGTPAFPRARYMVSRDEWLFWSQKPDLKDILAGDDMKSQLRAGAEANLLAMKDKVQMLNPGDEIAPGIKTIPCPGHTPGHIMVEVKSRGQKLIFASDVVLHPAHIEKPEWCTMFDLKPAAVASARREFFKLVSAGSSLVMVPHFPFPCLGHITGKEGGWHWQALPAS